MAVSKFLLAEGETFPVANSTDATSEFTVPYGVNEQARQR